MAQGRIYRAAFDAVAVSAVQDLVSLLTASTSTLEVLEFGISQATKVGDASEQQLFLKLTSGATTVGSGGGTMTPIARNIGDTAATTVARINDTTPATAGTIIIDDAFYWNCRIPFVRQFTPQTIKAIRPSTRIVFGLYTAPSVSITCSAYILFQEST